MYRIAVALGVLVMFTTTVEAQFKGAGKVSTAVIENDFPINTTNFSFLGGVEKGKINIKPSKKDGDGGLTLQLSLKGVDCPAEPAGNDSDPGTCGPKDDPNPPVGVLTLDVIAVGTTFTEIAGIPFFLEKGKAVFPSTGKNKQGAGSFGALITTIFTRPLGVGLLRLRTDGSDSDHPTTGCGAIPLPPANTCADGALWAFGGIRVGEDLALSCVTTIECDNGGVNPTLVCTGGACVPEPCANDAACDQNGMGSGGSGECDCGAGVCCDPATNAGCAAIC